MARRPVFLPDPHGQSFVRTCHVEFTWHAGLAVSQKQKSILSLHEAAKAKFGVGPLLEISSKSPDRLGVALSAFNLSLSVPARTRSVSVECAFQSSKVFVKGGPYRDLLNMSSREAKRDERLRNSGNLEHFDFGGVSWDLEPQTAFYDWLYISALCAKPQLAGELDAFAGFTDIEFNPDKSINCQAYSVALFVSLKQTGMLAEALSSQDAFLSCVRSRRVSNAHQDDMVQARLF